MVIGRTKRYIDLDLSHTEIITTNKIIDISDSKMKPVLIKQNGKIQLSYVMCMTLSFVNQ